MLIEGFATTPLQDVYGDIIIPDAFNDLSSFLRRPELRHCHCNKECCDVGRVVELHLTDNGLFIRAQIFENRKDIVEAIRTGRLRAFSIGFKCLDFGPDSATGIRTLKKLRLREISLTESPANPGTYFKVCDDTTSPANISSPHFRPTLNWSVERIERAARKLVEASHGNKSAFKLHSDLAKLFSLLPPGQESAVLTETAKVINDLASESNRKWADYIFSIPFENPKAA